MIMLRSARMGSIERQEIRDRLAGDWPQDFRTLADLLNNRYSCRAFRPEPVPRYVIEQVMGLAQLSPSWANTQPWEVIVTSGAATERLREALLNDLDSDDALQPSDIPFPEGYTGVRQDRRREVAWQLYESVGVAKGDRRASAVQARENQRLFGAPHALLIHTKREMGPYGAIDCGLYLGTLMLGIEAMGLGIIAQAALAQHSGVIKSMFDIPDDTMFVVGASFGYPEPGHRANGFRSRRADPADNVMWAEA
jgi:nitroreductase